ncbi:MAG: hypothetical protein Q7U34_10585, partial [Anaerolineales bacterium]|nr:hypothetical protein [Anaerolineales bacterium]
LRGSMKYHLRVRTVTGVTLLVFSGLALAFGPRTSRASAAATPPPGPDRVAAVVVDYTSYEWWLTRWQDDKVVCQIFADHAGLPTGSDIYKACGKDIFDKWAVTQPCKGLDQGDVSSDCSGYYLHFVQSAPAKRKIAVTLPPPVVWVSLEGCTSTSSTNYCVGQPLLVLTAEEPLPNEKITGIEGTLDGEPFACDATCKLPLDTTGEESIAVDFWAYSSYGDSSQPYQAQVRVAENEDASDGQSWYVDVLSTQWAGAPLAGCAQTWEAFPPVGGPPAWLRTPEKPEDLTSNIPYDYLAGNLIVQGAVDVSNCLDGGLLPNGAANPCGREAGQTTVTEWQNRFDGLIFNVAQDTGIPAQLLKNLFSRESQFWPGIVKSIPEVGLGQLTDNGADTALLWNPSFYEQFCPLVLQDSVCRKGYPHLKASEQATLRGALVRSVDAFCADCPLGLDLTQADFSVGVFAQTLLANCEQAGRIVRNVTGKAPGQASGYEDLWRFTLVNYNAGPGCLAKAAQDTRRAGKPLDWVNVSALLTPACQRAIDYVEDISR